MDGEQRFLPKKLGLKPRPLGRGVCQSDYISSVSESLVKDESEKYSLCSSRVDSFPFLTVAAGGVWLCSSLCSGGVSAFLTVGGGGVWLCSSLCSGGVSAFLTVAAGIVMFVGM